MPLLTIKPSRGTVGFFAALVLGLLVRRGLQRHEQQLEARDAPPAYTTRRLLYCVLGADAQRMLWPRPTDNAQAIWEAKITARLRRLESTRRTGAWLAPCAPIAERLAARLDALPHAPRAAALAHGAHVTLADGAREPLRALELIERGTFGTQLAALALEVSTLSDGAEAGWDAPLAPAATDLRGAAPEPAEAAALPADADYAVLTGGDTVLYQSARDRRLHQLRFTDDGAAPADRALGVGAPVRGAWRDGAALAAGDDGDALVLPEGESARVVPLPAPLAHGAQALGEWQLARTPSRLWLLADDAGRPRLWSTARDGAPAWSETAGPADWRELSTVGMALAADPAGGDAVHALLVRGGASGSYVERWPAAASTAAPSGALGTPAAALREFSGYNPHARTCTAGDANYVLLAADDGITVIASRGAATSRAVLRYAQWGALSGTRLELSCTPRAALLFADFAGRPASLAYFEPETPEAQLVEPPRYGSIARTVGAALTAGGALVALMDNGASLRAFRRVGRNAAWEGGALLAELAPTPGGAPSPDERTLEVGAVVATGERVALLASARYGYRRFVARLASRDGGVTWR